MAAVCLGIDKPILSLIVRVTLENTREATRMESWYYMLGSEQVGSISDAEMRSLAQSGQIKADCLVWNKIFGGTWKLLRETEFYDAPLP